MDHHRRGRVHKRCARAPRPGIRVNASHSDGEGGLLYLASALLILILLVHAQNSWLLLFRFVWSRIAIKTALSNLYGLPWALSAWFLAFQMDWPPNERTVSAFKHPVLGMFASPIYAIRSIRCSMSMIDSQSIANRMSGCRTGSPGYQVQGPLVRVIPSTGDVYRSIIQ